MSSETFDIQPSVISHKVTNHSIDEDVVKSENEMINDFNREIDNRLKDTFRRLYSLY